MSKSVWEGGDRRGKEGSNKWEIIERLERRKSISATLESSIFAFIFIPPSCLFAAYFLSFPSFSLISKQYSCLWLYLTPYPPTSNRTGNLLPCPGLSDSFLEPIAGMRLPSLCKKSLQWGHHLLRVPPIPTTNPISAYLDLTDTASSHCQLHHIYPCNTSERGGGNCCGSKWAGARLQAKNHSSLKEAVCDAPCLGSPDTTANP